MRWEAVSSVPGAERIKGRRGRKAEVRGGRDRGWRARNVPAILQKVVFMCSSSTGGREAWGRVGINRMSLLRSVAPFGIWLGQEGQCK